MSENHCCYILQNGANLTYNGYTNNTKRRIRQHNSEIMGVAKATRGKPTWRYLVWVTSSLGHIARIYQEHRTQF